MPRRISNPPNPYERTRVEWLGPPPPATLEVFEEHAKSCLTRNTSPDVPFDWGVNPYRGCQHACAYCYARRTHSFLGFGAGTDFDKKIVVKVNAPELLERELRRPSWRGVPVTLSGVTDAYQPLEASYELTRRCVAVLERHGNPLSIITKSALVRRDVDLLGRLARRTTVQVFLSVPFLDPARARALEPGAPTPSARLAAVRVLADAGVECGVAIAPLIPGLNDREIPAILERARDAGARSAFLTLLRLPGEVEPVFRERLREAFPDRAERVLSALAEMRGGRLDEARFGRRMHGAGPRWESVRALFELYRRRLGLAGGDAPLDPVGRRPAPAPPEEPRPRQGTLFDTG